MGELIRSRDWSETSLGPLAHWPQSLQTALSMVCLSSTPMVLSWGPELLQLYNDAFRDLMQADKHPAALGRPAAINEAARWPELGPLFASVLTEGCTLACDEVRSSQNEDAVLRLSSEYSEWLSPVFGEQGALAGVLTVLRAGSASSPSRVVLESASEPLRHILLDDSPVAICATEGPQHRYVLANPSYERMVNKSNLLGRPITEVFPEIVGTSLMDVFNRVYETGEPFVTDAYLIPLDMKNEGKVQETYFRFNLVAMRNRAGAVTGWICSAVDITEQVRARQEAEADRTLLEAVIAGMHTGVVVAEAPSGATLFVNPAVERILGPSLPGLTEHNYRGYRAFHSNGQAFAERDYPIARALRGERMIEQELSVLDGHGNLRTLSVSALPVQVGTGERVAAVVAFNDVTERKDAELQRRDLLMQAEQARSQAEQASRAKDEFMAILGHELRNPLAPITTALYLMNRDGDEKTSRERTVIQRQVDHLVQLVDDLLDVSRVTGGKVQLKRRRLQLAEVVSKAVEMASPLLEERGHRLSVAVPADGLPVYGDLGRLAQVVSNLLTNAAKYTPRGGRIAVDALRELDELVLAVRDTGIGIAEKMLPRVFDMFAQERQSLDRSRGGLGLGLSIVRSLVILHGGTVSAHSEGEGLGSAFVVRLPVASEQTPVEEPVRRRPLPQRPVHSLPPLVHRVLVVDDNEDAANTLGYALEGMGHEVRVCYDGPSALRAAADFEPELGLLDIGLPVMDGYELAARLRELLAARRVRLVAVTGYGQASDREKAYAAGFDAHVVKPLPLDMLEAIIEDLAAEREQGP